MAEVLKFGCMTQPLAIVRREMGKSLTYDIEKMYKGLNDICDKWLPLLNAEETECFHKFVEKHRKGIEQKRLILLKATGDNVQYRKAYKNFISVYGLSVKDKVKLRMQLYEDKRGNLLQRLKVSLFRHKYYILKMDAK